MRRPFAKSRITKGVSFFFSAREGDEKVNNLHATGSTVLATGEDGTPGSSSVD